MNQAVDAFDKSDPKPPLFHTNPFYKYTEGFLERLHVRYLEKEQENFPVFALFLDTKIHRTKKISHSSMSLLITTMPSFHYNANNKANKGGEGWDTKKASFGKGWATFQPRENCFLLARWSGRECVARPFAIEKRTGLKEEMLG